MRVLLALLGHQVRMLMRPRRFLGLALLAGVPGIVLAVIGATEEAGPGVVGDATANLGAATFPIASLVLAAATLREERDEGTLPYLYLKPIGRLSMAAASWAAAALATMALGAVAWGAVVVASGLLGAGMEEALAAGSLFLPAALGYSALFVPLGYLVPRVVLTGLAYVIVWEQIIARLVTGVANTSVWRFALSIYADLVPGAGGGMAPALGPVEPGVWGGAAKLAVTAVLGVALLTWALKRRDAV